MMPSLMEAFLDTGEQRHSSARSGPLDGHLQADGTSLVHLPQGSHQSLHDLMGRAEGRLILRDHEDC